MRKSCVTKRPEGDSSANLGRVCTASDMRGRAGREPGGWGAPRCHCGASAGPKRSEVSIRPGTGQGARVSILPQEGAQGAACPGPGGGRARQARQDHTDHTTAHLWEEPPSRRGDPSRQPGAGKRGRARPPPSWEGEQPRHGLPREIKNRTSARPRSPARGRLPERTETRTVCSPSSPRQRHSARRASTIHG